MRRLAPRGDGGAGAAEYVGLVELAALILGTLWAVGIPSKVETHVSAALCHLLDEPDCANPQATGGQNGTGNGGQNGGQNNGDQNDGGQNGRNGDGQGNGDEPSLADLQKNADNAQKAADNASSKYGNIKQQIIDLLKDFIGITDIENCITKGSISSCLWAAFDVGSWIFAALKIGKFAKAVKDAIVLWKDFNRGRKIIDRAKDAAKRARELLKKRRRECGLPVPASLPIPRHAPPGVVRAAFAYAGGTHVSLAAAYAKPRKPGACGPEDPGEGREPPPPSKGDLKNVDPDRLEQEFGDDAAHEIKRETLGRGAKISRYDIKRDPKTGRLYLINKKDPKAPPIDTGYTSKGG